MKARVCKFCDGVGHTAFNCRLRPKTKLRRARMKRLGKHAELWAETRERWLENNRKAVYECYLCEKPLLRGELTLDHIKSRSRHPELRYELTNLAPCCWQCNEKKGSRDIEELEV